MTKNHPILQLGMRDAQTHNAVSELQTLLGLNPSGIFDKMTVARVQFFQSQHHITPNGIVGAHTWEALAIAHDVEIASHTPKRPAPSPKRPAPSGNMAPAPQVVETGPLRAQILKAASDELGNSESEGGNLGPTVARYKAAAHSTMGEPWCADFVSYILQKTAPGLIVPSDTSMEIQKEFADKGTFHSAKSGYKPKPGDLIFFDHGHKHSYTHSSNNSNANYNHGHIGFVVSVDADGTLHTIEGNKLVKSHVEKGGPAWDPNTPYCVTEVTYKPKDKSVMGYGSISEMAAAKSIKVANNHPMSDADIVHAMTAGRYTMQLQETGRETSIHGLPIATGNIVLTSPEGKKYSYPFRSGGYTDPDRPGQQNTSLPGLETSLGKRGSSINARYGVFWGTIEMNTTDIARGFKGPDGTGSWIKLIHYDDTSSENFGIHVDGPSSGDARSHFGDGSHGCVAVEQQYAKQLFDLLQQLPASQRPTYVDVLPAAIPSNQHPSGIPPKQVTDRRTVRQ